MIRLLRLALRVAIVIDGRLKVEVWLVGLVQRGINVVLVVGGQAQLVAVTGVHMLPNLLRRKLFVHQRVLPDAEEHQEALVARGERGKEVLVLAAGYRNGIRYDQCCLLLGYGRHILPLDAHVGLPTEDVRVEADVVL